MRVDQLERDTAVVDFTARLLAGLVRTGNTDALRHALPDALPWVTFLPPDDLDAMLGELIETTQGATALENLERWQYEVTGGGRVWYLIDDDNRTAWLIYAGTAHPKATD